ncbi:PAAR domain-containing protein [Micromonospora sp. SH-82]|uniref:PAAR domain-containing protein n=1 Tax=Micromonospora sp. SH-82 TaxID=3132938 RepID=UPI003EC06D3D
MPAAARVGDQISHLAVKPPPVPAGSVPVALPSGPPTGTVGPPSGRALPPGTPTVTPMLGVASVQIAGRPAAVVGTVCVCPLHVPLLMTNVVIPAPVPPVRRVLIGGFPAARQGDSITCRATVSSGAASVQIGG